MNGARVGWIERSDTHRYHRRMTNYRRNRLDGGTYFFMVNLADRFGALLTTTLNCSVTPSRYTKLRHPFNIDAMVDLPDHLHAVWTLPPTDAGYALRWLLIKTVLLTISHGGRATLDESRSRGERGVWQRRYWEHTVRDNRDLTSHIDYIHFNPLKHGHVARVADWPYSSFHRLVRAGMLPLDWGGDVTALDGDFGER